MPFKHNSANIPAEMEFPLIEEGWYTLRIFDAEEQRSSKGNDMILAKCEVMDDERYPVGKTSIWHYVVFLPEGTPGAGISVHFRKCAGLPYGGDDIVDAEDWKGKKFKGFITTKTHDGKTRNTISKISPLQEKADDEIPF